MSTTKLPPWKNSTQILLEQIRRLPEGHKTEIIERAHELANAKWREATGGSLQYGGERVLYYDSEVWSEAYEAVMKDNR